MSKTVVYLARIIALIWAGWWTLFGLLSGLGEGLDVIGVIRHLIRFMEKDLSGLTK
jgi:hypothetical protein